MNRMLYDTLRGKLQRLCRIWGGSIRWNQIERWLDNFAAPEDDNGHERLHALYLLSQFMFFGDNELRVLLRWLFYSFRHSLVSVIRRRNGDTMASALVEHELQRDLSSTRFVGIGSAAESGAHLLYILRQESELGTESFLTQSELSALMKAEANDAVLLRSVNYYVFIDDVCGSSTQVDRYTKGIVSELRLRAPQAKIYYYVLFGTAAGLSLVRASRRFDCVEAIYELDNSFRCFDVESRYAPPATLAGQIDWDFAQQMCLTHGQRLSNPPLGYKDGQLLLGLPRNTPNNTLPIFWADKHWYPLFVRYAKRGRAPK